MKRLHWPMLTHPPVTIACQHSVLVPHWHEPADMGKLDRVTEYFCESCLRSFPRT